ncbi:MAG: hypothetical protein LBK82_15235, partial [Planctomycetaceae bacterium]|nr:hypothetical protein [Planctomycetaceae bacterium]
MLGYKFIDEAKYMQWEKPIQISDSQKGRVKIDWLTGQPDKQSAEKLNLKKRPRARPKEKINFHAHITKEALLIDDKRIDIPLTGRRTNNEEYETTIGIPHPFTYLLMKLFAYRDRRKDEKKLQGQHHAFDVFKIIALLTENELDETIKLGIIHAENDFVREAREITQDYFNDLKSDGSNAIQTQ